MNASLVAVHAPAPTFQAPGPAPTPAGSSRASFGATPTATVTPSSLEGALGSTSQRAEVRGWAELVRTKRVCSVGSCANVLEPGWPWKRCPGCKEADIKKTVVSGTFLIISTVLCDRKLAYRCRLFPNLSKRVGGQRNYCRNTVSCSSCHAAMTIRLNVARAGQPLFCASCRSVQVVSPEVPIQQPALTTMGPPPQIPDEMRRKMPASQPLTFPDEKRALETAVAFVHPDHRHFLYGPDVAPPPLDIGRRSLSYNIPIQSSYVGAPHYGPRGEILARIPGTIAMEQAHRASAVAHPVMSPQTGLTPAQSIVIPPSDPTESVHQDKSRRHPKTAPSAPTIAQAKDEAPPYKRKRTRPPALLVNTSLVPERACVSSGCTGRIAAGTKGEFCSDCSFVLWRKQFRARVAGLSASFVSGRGTAAEGKGAEGSSRGSASNSATPDDDAMDVDDDELPLAVVLRRKRRTAALEKAAPALTTPQASPSPTLSSDPQPVKTATAPPPATTPSPEVGLMLSPRVETPFPTDAAPATAPQIVATSPAAAKSVTITIRPSTTSTPLRVSPSSQVQSPPNTTEPSFVAAPLKVERKLAQSPPTSRSASPDIPLRQVTSPVRAPLAAALVSSEDAPPLATSSKAESVVKEAKGVMQDAVSVVQEPDSIVQEAEGTVQEAEGTVQEVEGVVQDAESVVQDAENEYESSSEEEVEEEIFDDSSSSRSSSPSPSLPSPVRPRLFIRIPSRRKRKDADVLRRQLAWDSDGSDLTPLEELTDEGESEIDPSDREDDTPTPTNTQPADSIVHEPGSDDAPLAHKPRRAPKHRGICSVPRCANLLIENSRWRLCNVCFAVRRAYVRRQKQAGLIPQDPVEEVGMIVNMPEDGDLTGYRKCNKRSCKRMIPPESAYKWKCCPPCRIITRNRTRLLRARGGPLHFSGEENEQAHPADARSETALLADGRIRRVKKSSRKSVASQPLSVTSSQVASAKVQDPRPLPEVPAYQHFAALLTAFHARFSEFKVAHAHYLRFKARQEAGTVDVQTISRNPIVFRFDGEYSVVADPSGGSVDDAVNCVLRNVQAALGLSFTIVGVDDGPENSVVAVLRCMYGAQVLLRAPTTPTQKSPTDVENVENVEATESPKEEPPSTLAVKMVGELQICVAWDRRHRFFPGQRILVRFRLVG
ncbi:hypothetical protein GY45DRAFT_1313619 [Cubamyces sp. BRFM 1775]|nr:hypothetical protein GY45DRAFT_1313619 [Cubamyces sp. BRFM 1775]